MMLVLLLFINALFALTYIVTEFALIYTNPLVLLMYRMLFSGIVLLLIQFVLDKNKLYIKKKDILFFVITALLHMYINFFSETYALKKISGVMTSMFYLLSPIFSAVIDYVFKKNSLTKWQWCIIFLGLITSMAMILINSPVTSSFEGLTWPYLLLLCSIFSSTLAWYRVKELLKNGYSLIAINGYASLLSGILFLSMIFGLGIENTIYEISSFSKTIVSAIALGLMSNIFAYNLYQLLLAKYSITSILLSELIAPCFTALYTWFLYDQIPKPNQIIFFIIFLFCIISFNYQEKKKSLLLKELSDKK